MKLKLTLCACVIAVSTTAFAGYRSGLNSYNFGNSRAGAKGSYSVTTENAAGVAKCSLNASGSVTFLNKTVKGVNFTATAQNYNGVRTSNYRLEIAGYAVDTGTKTASYTWSKQVNRTLVSASLPIMVGPVPCTVSGSVGGGASISYTFQLGSSGIGLSGSAAGWANGTASAGVGPTLLNLALRSKLELARTSLNPTINVGFASMSGRATLAYNPVNIDFGVALLSYSKVWYEYVLATYSAPSRTITLVTL